MSSVRPRPGDAEIGDQHPVRASVLFGDENIGRLDISMQQSFAVQRVQPLGDFGDDPDRPVERKRVGSAPDQLSQIDTVDILHRDPQAAAVLAPVTHRDQVGMAHARRDGGLAQKSRAEHRIAGVSVGQDLQRVLAR